jgi:hypothetical protein
MYYNFMPDFMDKYAEYELKAAREAGADDASLRELSTKMDGYRELYKNPVMIFLFTYMEILPVGVVISLIAALILKRRKKEDAVASGA